MTRSNDRQGEVRSRDEQWIWNEYSIADLRVLPISRPEVTTSGRARVGLVNAAEDCPEND